MYLSEIDLVCLAAGFGSSMFIFWTCQAASSVFTVFVKG